MVDIWVHMGVIWGSYGGHMRIILSLMEVLWCHMGIILEAYGGYLKNVPQTYGSGRDPSPPLLEDFHKKTFFFPTLFMAVCVLGPLVLNISATYREQ